MKKTLKIKWIVLPVSMVMVCIGMQAMADSFNITNVLASGGSAGISSWPTNAPGTNGLPRLTGGAVNVMNNAQAGFYFTCNPLLNITNSTTNTVILIRNYSGGAPSITSDTNGWTYVNGWEGTWTMNLTFVVPNQTNTFTWFTNLGEAWLYGANWVGVYAVTNNGPTGMVFTNVDCGLNKKIIPIRYP